MKKKNKQALLNVKFYFRFFFWNIMHSPDLRCIDTCIHLISKKLKFHTFRHVYSFTRAITCNRKPKTFMHFRKNVDQNSPKLNSPKIKGPLNIRLEVKLRWSSRYKMSVSCCLVWPVGSRSTLRLEWWSPWYKIYISSEDSRSSRYKISISHDFSEDPLDTRSEVKIRWSSRYKIPVSCSLVEK